MLYPNNLLNIKNLDDNLNFKSFARIMQGNMNTSDLKKVKKIREDLKNYNIYDFLKTISALNLLAENQNKSVIFSCMINIALSIPESEINFDNIMSINKFKQIVNDFENLDIKRNIDPPEFPFIQSIIYYNNYNLFMGTNTLSVEALQNFLIVFSKLKEHLDNSIAVAMERLIISFLEITSLVAKDLSLTINDIESIELPVNIFIPKKSDLDRLKEIITFKRKHLDSLFKDKDLFLNYCCSLNSCNVNNALDFDNQFYYATPFLNNFENVILLDITIIPMLLFHELVKFSLKSNTTIHMINEYNNFEWSRIAYYFSELDNNKIKESGFNIVLDDKDMYKERLYSSGNDGIIINIGIFDNGNNFNDNLFCDEYKFCEKRNYIDKRLDYIIDQLKVNKVEEEKIFIVITPITIGRSSFLGINKQTKNKPLKLSPYELKAISINQKNDNLFIQRYIYAKNRLNFQKDSLFSELNLLSQYVSHGQSFYFGDDLDTKQAFIHIFGDFSSEYILKSDKKLNKHLVENYDGKHLCEIEKSDGDIYVYNNNFLDKKMNFYLEFKNIGIWIITEKITVIEKWDIYYSFLDLFSYWICEFKKYFDAISFKHNQIIVEIKLSDDAIEYQKEEEILQNIEEILDYSISENKLVLQISSKVMQKLNCKSNIKEKEIIAYLLNIIEEFSNEKLINHNVIDSIFKNEYKKKMTVLNYFEYPYLKPFSSRKKRSISSSDENLIIDDIGLYVKNNLGFNYGVVKQEDREYITKEIVSKLYKDISDSISKYDGGKLVRALYYESERILSQLMVLNKTYANNIVCYPYHKDEINTNYNELNKASVSIKFLIELVSSLFPNGAKEPSEYEMEYLLAMSAELIDWAYKNDLFHYKIFSTPMEILKSNRIGLKKDEFIKANISFQMARTEKMDYIGKNKMKIINSFSKRVPIDDINYDEIFKDEFGYTLNDLLYFVTALLDIGEEKQGEIFEINLESLFNVLSNDINRETFDLIIKNLSLQQREDFLTPPKPFRKEDVYPWRFNRELSFTRRPLILNCNTIIWGNRNISNSTFYVFDLISDGKINAKSKKMKDLKSLISDKNGKDFNDKVYKYISNTNHDFITDKNVKNINGKYIRDETNQDLGDIDVLYISKERSAIVLVETKNFNMSKNFYEIYNEYQDMFVDSEEHKSFLTKHRRRAEWISQNLNEVIKHYKLPNKKWKVKYMFVFNEYLISKDTFDINENIISIAQLNRKYLLNIK